MRVNPLRRPRSLRGLARALVAMGAASVLALGGVLVAAAPAAQAAATLDQSYEGRFCTWSANHGGTQTFTAGRSGALTAASVDVASVSAGAQLRLDVAGSGVTATGTTLIRTTTSTGWTTVTFADPIRVVAGVQYALSASVDFGGTVQLRCGVPSVGDPEYAGGRLVTDPSSPSTLSIDGNFRTFVDAGPDAPTGATATVGAAGITVAWTDPAGLVTGDVVEVVSRSTGETQRIRAGVGSATFSGASLTPGTAYAFDLRARTASGLDGPTASTTATWSTVPGAPTGVAAAPAGDGEAIATWSAPATDGASPILAYGVQHRAQGSAQWIDGAVVPAGVRSATLSGLSPLVPNEVRVAAVNANGPGAWGTSAFVTPRTVPGAPTVTAVDPSNAAIALTVAPPAQTGGGDAVGYRVEHRLAGDEGAWTASASVSAAASSVVVTGLDNGRAYDVRVAFETTVGTGPWAQATSTPRTTPGAPVGLVATPGDGSLALSWQAPTSDGGAAISEWVVAYRVDGGGWMRDAAVDGTTAVIAGLPNGATVEATVAAVNAAGQGPAVSVDGVPFGPATAPTSLVVEPLDGGVALAWSAPTSPNGAPVTSYVVEHRSSPDGSWTAEGVTIDGTSATIAGLANGTAVEVRVSALNGTTGVPATTTTIPFAFLPTASVAGAPLGDEVVRPGATIDVAASGLPANARVQAFLRPAAATSTETMLSSRFASPSALDAGVAAPMDGVLVGEGVVDETGAIAFEVIVPADLATGEYELVLRLSDAGSERAPAVTAFAVERPAVVDPTPEATAPSAPSAPSAPTAPTAPAPTASAPTPTAAAHALPRTGTEALAPMLALAAAALVLGGALVRRRALR